MAEIPLQYRKDYAYLKEKSAKGTLAKDNAILVKLQAAAKTLPGLRNAIDDLRIQY